MAADNRSSRDIERELEEERAELRGTLDQIWNRLTFEDAWDRVGVYLRDNRSDYGKTLARLIEEKPIAVGLTLVGVTWLLFGPSSKPARAYRNDAYRSRDVPHDRDPVTGAGLARSEAERGADRSGSLSAGTAAGTATTASDAPRSPQAADAGRARERSSVGTGAGAGAGAGTAHGATSVSNAPQGGHMGGTTRGTAEASTAGPGPSPKASAAGDSTGAGTPPARPAGSAPTSLGTTAREQEGPSPSHGHSGSTETGEKPEDADKSEEKGSAPGSTSA